MLSIAVGQTFVPFGVSTYFCQSGLAGHGAAVPDTVALPTPAAPARAGPPEASAHAASSKALPSATTPRPHRRRAPGADREGRPRTPRKLDILAPR
ncbi:MAG TPA: hypothetical protein VH089_19150, partial [Streptosporangiaceae bacterium]|nr:hypothetical protein [Streptosporangiaceae bacterium]